MNLRDTKLRFAAVLKEILAAETLTDPILNQKLQMVLSDLREIPEAKKDKNINSAYHLLQHYLADADIRAKEPTYAESQRTSLQKKIDKLSASEGHK